MTEDFRIPVKVWLKAATYRNLAARGGGEVGPLLEALADKLAEPKPKAAARGRWRRFTAEDQEQLIALHKAGHSDGEIGRRMDRQQPFISVKRRALGLEANGRKIA